MMTATMTAMLKEFLEDCSSEPALSLLLQWGKPEDCAPRQVDAWMMLKNQYGDSWHPDPVETL
ncbi:MAG: hypothetical protein ACFE0I_10155 [Elainellaceae cyanobacterium]